MLFADEACNKEEEVRWCRQRSLTRTIRTSDYKEQGHYFVSEVVFFFFFFFLVFFFAPLSVSSLVATGAGEGAAGSINPLQKCLYCVTAAASAS
mmetsp:Transcript_32731/g.54108  ORF Transcript_32731/g.54108 Transcript_32731/m.54108 type:complete len:94 (-) Transcript_32731:1440-1721(-)